MKKLLAVIMCFIISLGITGCEIPKAVDPDYADAQKTMEFLADAIERKDAEAIKEKFSPYAKEHIYNFSKKIDRLIEEFPQWSGEYEITATYQRWSNHGKITYMHTPSFDFSDENSSYRFRVIYYTESDEDKSKLGYYSIQIFDRLAEDYSKEVYMHGVEDEPDIWLWDYTESDLYY